MIFYYCILFQSCISRLMVVAWRRRNARLHEKVLCFFYNCSSLLQNGGGGGQPTSCQQTWPAAALAEPKYFTTVQYSISTRYPLEPAFSVQHPPQSLSPQVSATRASRVTPRAEILICLLPYDALSPLVLKNAIRLLLWTKLNDLLPM
jgi:hypothetical protein